MILSAVNYFLSLSSSALFIRLFGSEMEPWHNAWRQDPASQAGQQGQRFLTDEQNLRVGNNCLRYSSLALFYDQFPLEMEPWHNAWHQDPASQAGQQGQRYPPHEREQRQAHQG